MLFSKAFDDQPQFRQAVLFKWTLRLRSHQIWHWDKRGQGCAAIVVGGQRGGSHVINMTGHWWNTRSLLGCQIAEGQRDVECGDWNVEPDTGQVWGEVLMTVAAGLQGDLNENEWQMLCFHGSIGFGVNTALQGASAKFSF